MVKIDKNKCIGCGLCASICPEGFDIINNKSHVKNQSASCIKQTISSCPMDAIILDKNDAGQDKSAPEEQENDSSGEKDCF